MRETVRIPSHVAIIMDGNGRWAKARGLPRAAGHKAGMNALHDTVRSASELGIRYLTLYAFSSENWSRPASEVSDLLGLLKIFIRRDLAELHRSNVEVKIIGNRAGLKPDILKLLEEAEQLTRGNDAMTLTIAFNYGSRDEIVRASIKLAQDVVNGKLSIEDIGQGALTARLDTAGVPDPDLVIRTSGEIRLSNFLMWQAAYAELVFVPCFWPDFDKAQLISALNEYDRRERRFGGLEAQVS
ncbi:MAG: isoprenyl transferase [Rhizobiaceae bacterium]